MMTGGKDDQVGGSLAVTDVFDISDPSKTFEALEDFPIAERWMPRGGYVDGMLIVCSGSGSKECFTYDGCSWTLLASMADSKDQASGVVIKGNPDR